MDAGTQRFRDRQLSDLILWARKIIVLLEATEKGPAETALQNAGWDEREELKAKLERLIVCSERAAKEGGVFLAR